MYRQLHFWMVGLVTGFFAGLIMLLVQLLLFHLLQGSFSPAFGLIYLVPFVAMSMAARRLRERYGDGVLRFGQAFRLSVLIGITTALVMATSVFFVYDILFDQALQLRAAQLNASVVKARPDMDFELLKQRRSLVSQLMSPFSLAVYYLVIQLLLLPVYAFIIAIFARRRRRDITDI